MVIVVVHKAIVLPLTHFFLCDSDFMLVLQKTMLAEQRTSQELREKKVSMTFLKVRARELQRCDMQGASQKDQSLE